MDRASEKEAASCPGNTSEEAISTDPAAGAVVVVGHAAVDVVEGVSPGRNVGGAVRVEVAVEDILELGLSDEVKVAAADNVDEMEAKADTDAVP